jgi:GNAT superfamily N-acetyltransferase
VARLKAGEPVERVALRPLERARLADFGWLPPALAPEWSLADLASAEGEVLAIAEGEGEAPVIGVLVVQRDAPLAGATTVGFIAVEPARRHRGLGGEAVLALERRLGGGRALAPVPEGRGLAVYFWLRVGYRPLRLAEAPGPPRGLAGPIAGIWMGRNLASGE